MTVGALRSLLYATPVVLSLSTTKAIQGQVGIKILGLTLFSKSFLLSYPPLSSIVGKLFGLAQCRDTQEKRIGRRHKCHQSSCTEIAESASSEKLHRLVVRTIAGLYFLYDSKLSGVAENMESGAGGTKATPQRKMIIRIARNGDGVKKTHRHSRKNWLLSEKDLHILADLVNTKANLHRRWQHRRGKIGCLQTLRVGNMHWRLCAS